LSSPEPAESDAEWPRRFIGRAIRWSSPGVGRQSWRKWLRPTPACGLFQDVHIEQDGFWSLTVYNSEGYLHPNPSNVYSVNSITAKKGPDGAVAIQFGGCDGEISNCLPVTPGWNYTVRLFRPRVEILDGRWQFPLAQPAG
jgi:hypothetical protein